jgi:hypothetical protein
MERQSYGKEHSIYIFLGNIILGGAVIVFLIKHDVEVQVV